MYKLAENVAWACRQWLVAVAALLIICGATRAEFLPEQDQDLKAAPEIERLFVIKTAENLLSEKDKLMFDDPENAKDGYVWTRTVIRNHYACLDTLANELTAPELADFYFEKSRLVTKNIRGEISASQFQPMELELEGRKQSYLDGILNAAKPQRQPDFERLNAVAKSAADKIHAYSMLAVDAAATHKP